MIITNNNITEASIAPSFDADAQAFFTAAGIDDSIQQFAVDSFVKQLKVHDIWDDLVAVYPFVGGNAISHKYNLKDPQNTDAAFRLTFVGGPTHSVNGVQFRDGGVYANSHINPDDTFGNKGPFSFGYYSQTPASIGGGNQGSTDDAYGESLQMICGDFGGTDLIVWDSWGEDARIISTSIEVSNLKGLLWFDYGTFNSTKQRVYNNDTILISGNNTPSRTTGVTEPLIIGGFSNNGSITSHNYNLQFAFYGKTLGPKASDFNLIVQTLMSNLNRSV